MKSLQSRQSFRGCLPLAPLRGPRSRERPSLRLTFAVGRVVLLSLRRRLSKFRTGRFGNVLPRRRLCLRFQSLGPAERNTIEHGVTNNNIVLLFAKTLRRSTRNGEHKKKNRGRKRAKRRKKKPNQSDKRRRKPRGPFVADVHPSVSRLLSRPRRRCYFPFLSPCDVVCFRWAVKKQREREEESRLLLKLFDAMPVVCALFVTRKGAFRRRRSDSFGFFSPRSPVDSLSLSLSLEMKSFFSNSIATQQRRSNPIKRKRETERERERKRSERDFLTRTP